MTVHSTAVERGYQRIWDLDLLEILLVATAFIAPLNLRMFRALTAYDVPPSATTRARNATPSEGERNRGQPFRLMPDPPRAIARRRSAPVRRLGGFRAALLVRRDGDPGGVRVNTYPSSERHASRRMREP